MAEKAGGDRTEKTAILFLVGLSRPHSRTASPYSDCKYKLSIMKLQRSRGVGQAVKEWAGSNGLRVKRNLLCENRVSKHAAICLLLQFANTPIMTDSVLYTNRCIC